MRKSGVLMHVTSLPSNGRVGTLGQAAYDFVDFVRDSGMNIWQMLPWGRPATPNRPIRARPPSPGIR